MLTVDTQHPLQEIAQDARRLMQISKPATRFVSGPQKRLSPLHQFTIPMPHSVTSIFVDRGLEQSAAAKLNQAYLDKASSLKRFCEDQYVLAIESSLESGAFDIHDLDKFVAGIQATLIARFDQYLQDLQHQVDTVTRRHKATTQESIPSRGGESRPIFKNESVPLLEKAFSVNAYPSRADKEVLAVQTEMEYKQVNIWFQNRRARSKKEGVTLQRTATFATQLHLPRFATASLSPEPHCVSPSEKERPLYWTENTPVHDPLRSQQDFLSLVTPPAYAFPTTYPPLFSAEASFSSDDGAVSFQTLFLRRCTTDAIQRPSIDIEQLVERMASLSLSSDISNSYTSPIPSFTLVLPRAPLPALIRAATASSRAQLSATLVSATGSSSASRSKETRKLYRALPVRLSRHFMIQQQSLSPVTSSRPISVPYSRPAAVERSRRSETRSPSPPHASRSSSLSSVASSRSSSSSWSTASSAGPLTPSASPRIEAFPLVKNASSPFTSPYVHRPSSIFDGVHVFPASSAFR